MASLASTTAMTSAPDFNPSISSHTPSSDSCTQGTGPGQRSTHKLRGGCLFVIFHNAQLLIVHGAPEGAHSLVLFDTCIIVLKRVVVCLTSGPERDFFFVFL